ncbi:MAG: D-alanyl-D-alanine carboxypeptidase [Pseudanabaena sp. ELA645]|jgi:D-alanyl-D-alanine carboxypeptidase/D-alanyl-D-alanine-endopeptidase (penicillin-binding protein 4)
MKIHTIFRLLCVLGIAIILTVSCSESNQEIDTQPAVTTSSQSATTAIAPSPSLKAIAPEFTLAPLEPPKSPINAQVQSYINRLVALGGSRETHGVWIQSGGRLLGSHQGTSALPSASVTKVATTLVALETFNPDHRFTTLIKYVGSIKNGVLQGDLIIQGGEDPFFVWEEAIVIGNLLTSKGIKRVSGNLVITGKFYMNFESSPRLAGDLFKQGLNSDHWTGDSETQYRSLAANTPRPKITIDGEVKVLPTSPNGAKLLIHHDSFPLAELLKKMNRFSNNIMADMFAESVGGAAVVSQKAADLAGVPRNEVQFVNGSGLGEANRMSPRAAVGMFLAIARYLKPYNMTIADVFTVIGKDEGILDERKLPKLAVIKSGSLNTVSTLAGALPTQKQGLVWFAIFNSGGDLQLFRLEQELLLNHLVENLGTVTSPTVELQISLKRQSETSRNQVTK